MERPPLQKEAVYFIVLVSYSKSKMASMKIVSSFATSVANYVSVFY